MKSSIKSSCFSELNSALKAINKKNQQSQKFTQQNTLNNLFNRSSSQASNILLTQTSQSTTQNVDIFSQRNSNANLKLQMNPSNKLEKKPSSEVFRTSCVDHGRKSSQVSSPKLKERSDKAGCQTSGRKSLYLNNSNQNGNNTNCNNSRQTVGQIKISLSKSQSKKNILQQAENQKESSSQNLKFVDSYVGKSVKTETCKLSRTQSKAKLTSPDKKNLRSQEKNAQSSKKKNSQFITQKRMLEPSSESDRNGFNMSCEEENYHFNNKENFHENIQTLSSHLITQNPLNKADEQTILQDSVINQKRDSQKFNQNIQQALLKKRSEGLIENKIPYQVSQVQQSQERRDSSGNNNKNNKTQQNSIYNLLSRAKSQDKILFHNNQDCNSVQQNNCQETTNNLTSSINGQQQSSMAIMMMILNSSNSSKAINSVAAQQQNSLTQNIAKPMQKSNSKVSLNSQKNIGQSNSKGNVLQATKQIIGNSQQNTQALNNSQHKQSSSISYLKSNCSNTGNLSKSNSSITKNNQLNYSRGISETMTDNTHILLTDHSFTNTSSNNQNVLKYIQQQQQQILNNQSANVNNLYRVASSSSINGKGNQIILNDNQEQHFQESMNQQNVITQNSFNSPQNIQFNQNGDQIQKLCVDDYRKYTNISANKTRNSEQNQMMQQPQKSYLDLANRQNTNNAQMLSNQKLNKCQSSSNINQNLNSQSDFIDCNANSLLKILNNNQYDLKTEQSQTQLGTSSTQKRMLNSSFNKTNTSFNPSQQNLQHSQKQINGSPQPRNSILLKTNQTESSFSQTQQPGGFQVSIGNQNAINNNQNVLISQYVQNFNANRTNTQQSETNFTFQNNSQNPSTSVVNQALNQDQDFNCQTEEEQMYVRYNNVNNNLQNDKYATSCFQGNVQDEDQQIDNIQRRCSQPVQHQQKGQNLVTQSQKPFSILFNNLFSNKNVNQKQNINCEEKNQSLIQNKNINQIKRKNSNSLVSYNSNLINLTSNTIRPNPKTESSPQDNKNEFSLNKQSNGQYINSLIVQRNSQGILPQEVQEKYKYKRTPSLTQFNFSNQQPTQIQIQPSSNKNTSFEGFNVNLKNIHQIDKKQQEDLFIEGLDLYPQNQQDQQQQQLNIQEQNNSNNKERLIDQNQSNQNQNGQTQIQIQMQAIYDKMKQKLMHYKSAEQKWINEKSNLKNQVESLQHQVNFLLEENSLYKRSVITFNNQNEKQPPNSIYSSIDAIFQNF